MCFIWRQIVHTREREPLHRRRRPLKTTRLSRVCTVFLQRREKKLIKTHKNTFFPETFLIVISELQTDVLQQVREMCGFQWTVTWWSRYHSFNSSLFTCVCVCIYDFGFKSHRQTQSWAITQTWWLSFIQITLCCYNQVENFVSPRTFKELKREKPPVSGGWNNRIQTFEMIFCESTKMFWAFNP